MHLGSQIDPLAGVSRIEESRPGFVATHGPHVMTGLVTGLPFSADVLSEHERGRTHTGFLARDSQGRLHRRTDLSPGLTTTHIADPIAGKAYSINSGAGAVSEAPYPSEQQIWNWFSDGPPDAERREIEGFLCFRLELNLHAPGMESSGVSGSAWLSPRIGLVAEE